MAFLRTTFCAVFVVTVVLSKPVCLSDGEDSSKSSESTESNSSEETDTHVEPSEEPAITDMPSAMEETDPTGTAAVLPSAGPSLATLNTSAVPDPEDPQASTDTDALQLMPDDPSQTPLGVDISQDMPSDPAQDSITADTQHALDPGLMQTDVVFGTDGTNQPQVTTTTYQELPKGATPPQAIKPTSPPFSTAQPMSIAVDPALTGVPVCFTFQFVTPEPEPPRGDSI